MNYLKVLVNRIVNTDYIEVDQEATGKKLKLLMDEKGITAVEMAKKLNCSRQAVYKWRKGDGIPEITNLYCLSKHLGVHMEDILVMNKEPVIEETYREGMLEDHEEHKMHKRLLSYLRLLRKVS